MEPTEAPSTFCTVNPWFEVPVVASNTIALFENIRHVRILLGLDGSEEKVRLKGYRIMHVFIRSFSGYFIVTFRDYLLLKISFNILECRYLIIPKGYFKEAGH